MHKTARHRSSFVGGDGFIAGVCEKTYILLGEAEEFFVRTRAILNDLRKATAQITYRQSL